MKDSSSVPAELMSNLLLSVLAFMEKTGMSPSEIEEVFGRCNRLMKSKAAKRADANLTSMAIGCDTVAGAVLRAWHRDPTFVDDNADPIPLFPRRGKLNLVSLVQSQDEDVDAESLVREMQRTGLI